MRFSVHTRGLAAGNSRRRAGLRLPPTEAVLSKSYSCVILCCECGRGRLEYLQEAALGRAFRGWLEAVIGRWSERTLQRIPDQIRNDNITNNCVATRRKVLLLRPDVTCPYRWWAGDGF